MVREPDAATRPTPQDNQLMSKHRVLSFKPCLRLEYRGEDGQSEAEQPDHPASLGDSITASHSDEVFGTHRCGKGFYEATMGHLLGNHAMQITNPKHIVGAFNPHLETLLRLTADEALFVGSHEHRNALFGLITEAKLTIEPKGCGIYTADSFLNISITSNAEHFLPVS